MARVTVKKVRTRIVRKRFIVWGLILVVVSSFILFSTNGVLKRISLESKKNDLVKKIADEKRIQDSLNLKIYLLQNDLTEVERIAREKYGMIKPGETVFYVKTK